MKYLKIFKVYIVMICYTYTRGKGLPPTELLSTHITSQIYLSFSERGGGAVVEGMWVLLS